jgi:predicted dehydrogenase
MAKLRAGLIGCGGIANAHARSALATGRMDLVAFCDVEKSRADQFNADYAGGSGKAFVSFDDMFDAVKLDMVYICLPPFAHTNEVEVAADHGVHILIEKPIAINMETANRMVAAVERTGIKAQVGFLSRFGDAASKLRWMIQGGKAGAPGLFIGWFMCNSLHSPWWRDKSKSGGQIVEQIVHTFDLTRYFLGEPVSVSCYHNNVFHADVENFTSEDVSATSILFQNGAVATVAGTDGAIPGQWINAYKVITQGITADFQDANNATLHFTSQPWEKQTSIRSNKDLFLAETVDLLDAIEGDREPMVPIIEGARTLELVLAASRSGEIGAPVKIG